MEFNHFLSSYFPDPSYGGRQLFADMVEQAIAADRLGYASVSVPEHHLINVLLTPSPLQMAVKVAAHTRHVEIVTSVIVLPLRDMRILAGEIAQADILCDGRLVLGVGRGAFATEMRRLGQPIENSREVFDESLNVLIRLLTEKEVEWHGKHYDFEPLTIMPRPLTEPMPSLMIAAMAPEAIYHSTKRGFHIQTTPLQGRHDVLVDQVDAFRRGRAELGAAGEHLRLMLSRVAWVASDEADARAKLALAHDYYARFDNVFTGPGLVHNGEIEPLPRAQSMEELGQNLLIGTPQQIVDQLGPYQDLEIDELILNCNIGASQTETLEAMQRLAEEVMPHFSQRKTVDAA